MMGLRVRMAQGTVLDATPQRLASWRHPGRTTALQVSTIMSLRKDCRMQIASASDHLRVCSALVSGK